MFPLALHNEKELLLRISEGDQRAFQELFDHYRPNVYTTALRMTGQAWQAEEILQDTFLKVWLKRSTLHEVVNFGGWLYTIGERLTLNAIMQQKREQNRFHKYGSSLEDSHVNVSDHALLEKEYEQILQEAVASLPQKQQQVYFLIKQQGMKREEAARVLQVSPETIKSNLDQAMKNIRAYCLARIGYLPTLIFLYELINL